MVADKGKQVLGKETSSDLTCRPWQHLKRVRGATTKKDTLLCQYNPIRQTQLFVRKRKFIIELFLLQENQVKVESREHIK